MGFPFNKLQIPFGLLAISNSINWDTAIYLSREPEEPTSVHSQRQFFVSGECQQKQPLPCFCRKHRWREAGEMSTIFKKSQQLQNSVDTKESKHSPYADGTVCRIRMIFKSNILQFYPVSVLRIMLIRYGAKQMATVKKLQWCTPLRLFFKVELIDFQLLMKTDNSVGLSQSPPICGSNMLGSLAICIPTSFWKRGPQ